MKVYQAATIDLSPFEQVRFGVSAARAYAVNPRDVERFDEFCRNEGIEVLILRCATSALDVVHRVERSGGNIMDCLVYYRRDLRKGVPLKDAQSMEVRPIGSAQADEIAEIAARAFEGYFGHYHADDRFERAAADATYRDWAARSCCDTSAADIVFGAFLASKIAGFITLKRHDEETVEIVLNGVDPAFQGRGIYRELVLEALRWAQSVGASACFVSTQLNNISVQKVWTRSGFELSASYYTFHKWFVTRT